MTLKLQKQFSHLRSYKLKKFLTDGGVNNKEFLDMILKIEQHCIVCTKYRRPPAKPIVTFPLTREFDESVAIDLKQNLSFI